VIFVTKDVPRMVFEGGFCSGAQNIWGNPYLNTTDISFIIIINAFFPTGVSAHHGIDHSTVKSKEKHFFPFLGGGSSLLVVVSSFTFQPQWLCEILTNHWI